MLTILGRAHIALDQRDAARGVYLEALRLFGEARNLPGIGTVLGGMARLESSAGRHVQAMRLVGAAAALRDGAGATGPLMPALERDAIADALAAIGDEATDDALAAGRSSALEDSIEYAAEVASESTR